MSVPDYWRLKKTRFRLIGTQCKECGAKKFPPTVVCPSCGSEDIEEYQFPLEGVLTNYTIVYQGPEKYRQQVPYIIGIVELTDGTRVTAQITDIDIENIDVGIPVEFTFRKYYEEGDEGIIMYGYKFRPKLKQ